MLQSLTHPTGALFCLQTSALQALQYWKRPSRAEGAWVYIPYIYTLVKTSRCSDIYPSVVSAGDTSWKVWSAYLQSLGPLSGMHLPGRLHDFGPGGLRGCAVLACHHRLSTTGLATTPLVRPFLPAFQHKKDLSESIILS